MSKISILEVCKIFRGLQLSKTERNRLNMNDPNVQEAVILNYDNVTDYNSTFTLENTVDINYYDKAEKVSVNLAKKYKDILIQTNDIILPVKLKEHVPRMISFSNAEKRNYIYSNELIILRPYTDKILPSFLFHIINSKYIVNMLNQKAIDYKKDNKQPNRITLEMLYSIEIENMDFKEQQKFVKEINLVNSKKMNIENRIKELTNV